MSPTLAFLRRYRVALGTALVLVLIGLGLLALRALTHEITYDQLRQTLHALTLRQLLPAMALTALSYLALTFYDVIALRVIGRPLPWRTAAIGAFASYTLTHNLGLSVLTGGSVRHRVYVAAGLDSLDVARVIALTGAAFWIGVSALAALAMSLHTGPLAIGPLHLGAGPTRASGALMLALLLALGTLCARARGPLRIWKISLALPDGPTLLAQLGVSLVDLVCAASALFVLLPHASLALFPAFVLAYALGLLVSVLSHVPGGIGVFEAVILAVIPQDHAQVLAALIAYRIVYYLLPLALALVLLAWREARASRAVNQVLGDSQALAGSLVPALSSTAAFLGGGMLLLSGSLPAIHDRLGGLSDVLPLPFIEASHIAASLVGTALLLVAPGLYRRLDGACLATRLLLVAGALFSLAKGIDYEEAIVCLAIAGILQVSRKLFYRRTALTAQPFTTGWATAITMALGLATWAGFFAYRHVAYQDDLWWKFALHGDAPRFLRATLASAVFLAAFALWRLLSPARPEDPAELSAEDAAAIRTILARSPRSETMLALTGDKRFLLSPARDAFVMYQVKGHSWIVMGDPVGEPAAWSDLLWALRERVDRAQGRLLLYEMTPAALDLAIGMGLQVIKFGEEAIVDLAGYDLQSPRLRSIRKAARVAERAGAELRIVPAEAVPVILDELERISDEWLAAKGAQEKGFSLGRFDRAYIEQFDVALVMVEGRIVAFANLWLTGVHHEASLDLMRQSAEAPSGTMAFLFTRLIGWAQTRGYQRFSLGMVPLAGIDARHLAPVWAKAGALVFARGERLYGFRGLRTFKQKFAVDWEPRYIAGPSGLGLLKGLRDASRLIAQGPSAPVQPLPPATDRPEAPPPAPALPRTPTPPVTASAPTPRPALA
ncbi:bifunctional lysylphosphatidylglycerol flippase/synthetase MprF [Novosphingobium sp. 1949]|uniref:Bifunctional lysylphosphatidylglycerol flippase/synthetase MprF n=1 Tax=Novosphingobium organovorum TaxID=2930092 RepID=A0ABT0BI36_9SPHN|nr:bifunctional lysylphosphatidylglycerol flippase/synthetase MprF [Novosphingobium organovorum]MCJ2184628.1 bifunctional lysylphosphatidylglycerol flippase/synthetase MprF [Novosphingobium organovorum]